MGTHHTLINGTSYAIKGGTDLIAGTSYQIGGGRTLVDGTAFEVKFGPSEYTITLTGSGGKITYNGVEQTGTFTVAAGESITITATAYCRASRFPQDAIIKLNGTTVSIKTATQAGQAVTATYTYTPEQDTSIIRSTTATGTGKLDNYSTTINIKTA